MSIQPASTEPAPYVRRRIQVGEWSITALSDGFFRLDGGAMWGVIPANMWRKWTPPGADNTILMALRPFLAERGADKVLIEVGAGQRWEPKWREIYHLTPTITLPESLAACGLDTGDITHVVASHCHWDHIGGQIAERDGELEAVFKNARHFAPAREIAMSRTTGHARRGSYRVEDLELIEQRGMLEAYEGSSELLPGLKAHVLGGHSAGVAVITLGEETPGDTAIYWSDVVPTAHHIQPPYIMAYDTDVATSYEQRSLWMQRAAEEGWIGLFYHDVDHAFGRLSREGRRFECEAIEGETLDSVVR